MPATSTATHPSGLRIHFTEADHLYIDDYGHHYTSGSAIVGRYKPPFDPDGAILARKAAEAGVTPEELQREWDLNRDKSSTYGTRCHENAEYQLREQYAKLHNRQNPKEEVAFQTIQDYIKKMLQHWQFVTTEQIIFSPRYWLAGTIDLIMVDHTTKTIWILDWKTNKVINRRGWTADSKLLGSLAHVEDCHLMHYTIQLALYRRLVLDEGYLDAAFPGYAIRNALLYVAPLATGVEFISTAPFDAEISLVLIDHLTTSIPF